MQFTVGDWMIDVVVLVDPESTVAEALATMRRRFCHSVIVNKSAANPEFGIVTSTDICDKIIARDESSLTLKVTEVMSSPLIQVKKSTTLKECAEIMRDKRIHHLPVVDDKGKLVGMISAADFMVAAEAIGRAPGERFS
jgi:CBS domain-containing protein